MFVSQFVTSQIFEFTLAFLPSLFSAWPNKSEQKFKYLKYLIFHHFQWVFIEANKINFFGRLESNFNYKSTYNGRKALYLNNPCPQADCVKSVQIRIFFWSVFSRIRTEYGEIRSICTLFTQWHLEKLINFSLCISCIIILTITDFLISPSFV